jgi:hypothetical protein
VTYKQPTACPCMESHGKGMNYQSSLKQAFWFCTASRPTH